MAFLQPQSPRQPVFQAPAIVLWLIGALAALHAARVWLSDPASPYLIYEFGLVPACYSSAFLANCMTGLGTVWERAIPFVSYMGLHSDIVHLAVNCLWLLAFGPVVARRFGGLLFLVFFILCGVAGAAFCLAVNWGSPMPVVGASGAISGLMAAAIRMMPGRTAPWMAGASQQPLAPLFSRQILMFAAVWAVINVLMAVIGLGAGEGEKISWEAHLGGFVAGLLLAGAFDALRPRSVGAPLED